MLGGLAVAEITEYGDVMLNVYVDEWGRRRINGLLEDGTKVVVVVVVVVIGRVVGEGLTWISA